MPEHAEPPADFTPAIEVILEELPAEGTIGLGTGHAAEAFIRALGPHVQKGLQLRAVPTSSVSARLASQVGIPVVDLASVEQLDLTVDGADEVDPSLNLIKGWGGALVREKIVAASSRRLVILVGPEKLVPILGSRGKLPVEVVPFALPLACHRLRRLGVEPQPRQKDGGGLFVTDNQNYIVDCLLAPLDDPESLEQELRDIPGLVGTGLFLEMAHTVVVQKAGGVEVRERQ